MAKKLVKKIKRAPVRRGGTATPKGMHMMPNGEMMLDSKMPMDKKATAKRMARERMR